MERRIKYEFADIFERIRTQNRGKGQEKFDRGGTVGGKPHSQGGTHFILSDTGTHIEEEKNEVNIPRELLDRKESFQFRNMTNYEVLNEILGLAGLSLNSKVTEVRSGDVIICVSSAWDNTKRNFRGTIREILNVINTSCGCNSFRDGGNINSKNNQQKLSTHYVKSKNT